MKYICIRENRHYFIKFAICELLNFINVFGQVGWGFWWDEDDDGEGDDDEEDDDEGDDGEGDADGGGAAEPTNAFAIATIPNMTDVISINIRNDWH